MIIKFDGVEIDGNAFAKITKSSKVYDKNFKLGSTICEAYKMLVNKEYINEIPNIVSLYDNETIIKTLYLTDYNDVDDAHYELSLEDAMTKFNFSYDASEIFEDGHTTLLAIFQDICSKAGVDTDINSFYGSTMQIGVYDNTYMARDYLGYIAEINASNLRITADNKLEFVAINTTPSKTINFEDISRFKIGVQHTITRVVLGDWQYGDDIGETYYINEDNVYAMSQATVQHIYNEINGFTYYNFKTNDCIMTDLKIGDLVKFKYNNDEYITFVQFDNTYFSGGEWFGGLEINLDSLVKQETQVIGEEARYRRIKRIVDYDSGRIDQIIEETPIVTKTETGVGIIQLENAHEGQLYYLSIKGDISLIYPSSTMGERLDGYPLVPSNSLVPSNELTPSRPCPHSIDLVYPSNTLYAKDSILLIDDVEYNLDLNYLNYINNQDCDEFVYDNGKCYIIRRVGINSSNELYPLGYEVIEPREDIILNVKANSTIQLKSFIGSILNCKYLLENIYTDVFATNVEVSSNISQLSNKIEATVQQVAGEDGTVTSGSIILAINNDTSEAVINADKISLEGKEIDLAAEGISITSPNFDVSPWGFVKMTSAEVYHLVAKGYLEITNTSDYNNGLVIQNDNDSNATFIGNQGLSIYRNSSSLGNRYFTYQIRENDYNQEYSYFEVSQESSYSTNYRGLQLSLDSGKLDFSLKTYNSSTGYVAPIFEVNQENNFTQVATNLYVEGNFVVQGQKNRVVQVDNKKVLLNAYETATPYFGDIGSDKTDENGYCKIEIEDIFSQTIEKDDYKVFIQECGDGKLYVKKYPDYFEVKGTPNLEFDWEIKAIQKGYKNIRLEESDK